MPPSGISIVEYLEAQPFRQQVKRMEAERGLNNEQAYLMVAAAVISHPATNFDRETITRAVDLFAANTDAESESLDAKYKNQLARMKKYNILKLHQARMHTHIILSHLSSSAFEYCEFRGKGDSLFKWCIWSSEVMGPGVEMVRVNCPSPNGDVFHVFSVGALAVWLAHMIEQGLDRWKNFVCCPSCAMKIPARESESTGFNLVEESGGHGMDYKHAIMFDFDQMHVEVDDMRDISPAMAELLTASI